MGKTLLNQDLGFNKELAYAVVIASTNAIVDFETMGSVVDVDIAADAFDSEVAPIDLRFAAGADDADGPKDVGGVEDAQVNPPFTEFNEWLVGHDDCVESV
ncbi:hypothetical protein V6N11_034191 [Hibiscus sabdariffa]|uniref:Uncharacterized protein n=1 Tax=Hibiscus sabdariffa TaxID=183260 RepID=A0ABR2S1M9_9ROSI